ncbi:hypothetical protein OK016_11915 [Vibrio chagasii]|nr:hypothetical protein [Vibrio chagasii]
MFQLKLLKRSACTKPRRWCILSNGPGDPEPCTYAIEATKVFSRKGLQSWYLSRPQILALASQARTVKMKFGHHGANHPILVES